MTSYSRTSRRIVSGSHIGKSPNELLARYKHWFGPLEATEWVGASFHPVRRPASHPDDCLGRTVRLGISPHESDDSATDVFQGEVGKVRHPPLALLRSPPPIQTKLDGSPKIVRCNLSPVTEHRHLRGFVTCATYVRMTQSDRQHGKLVATRLLQLKRGQPVRDQSPQLLLSIDVTEFGRPRCPIGVWG